MIEEVSIIPPPRNSETPFCHALSVHGFLCDRPCIPRNLLSFGVYARK